MSQQNRTTLKSYFNTGSRPTQEEFADLIDSSLNLTDDGIFDDGGNLGLGHSSPASTLSVNGNVTVSPNNDDAPGNGLFVHGTVGIGDGFTNPTAKLAVHGSVYIGNTGTTDPGANSLKVDGNIVAEGDLSTRSNASITGTLHAMGDTTISGDLTLADTKHIATDEVRARDSGGLKLHEDGGHGLLIHDDSGDVSADGNLTLANNKHVATDVVRALDGSGLKLHEDGGHGLLIHDNSGDVSADGNLTLANNKHVATDEVRALDGSGLKLHEDGGRGLLIHDNSGDVSADGNLTLANNKHVATDEVRARDSGGLKIFDAGGTHGLMVHDNGNVSIGSTGPENYKLHVEGDLRVTADIEARSLSLTGDTHQTTFEGAHEGKHYSTAEINVPDNKVVVGLVAKRYRHDHGDKDFYTFALKYK